MNKINFLSSHSHTLRNGTGIAMSMRNLQEALTTLGVISQWCNTNVVDLHENYDAFLKLQSESILNDDSSPNLVIAINFDGYHLLGRRLGGKLIKMVHVRTNYIELAEIAPPAQSEHYRKCALFLKQNISMSDAVITTSHHTLDTLRCCSDVSLPSYQLVLPNALDSQLQTALSQPTARSSKPLILAYGKATWRKNFLQALKASKLLHDRGIAHQFLLIAEGESLREIQNFIDVYKMHHVEIAPMTEDRYVLAQFLKQAWVVCHPAIQEDFGNVYLEAASAHVPVVAIRNPITLEHCIEPFAGKLVSDNPISIADACEAIFNHLSHNELPSAMNFQTRYTQWNWEIAAKTLLNFCQHVISCG